MSALGTSAILAIIAVAILYPVLTIIFSEMQRLQERKNSPYVKALRQFQLTVLPMAALYVLITRVANVDAFPKDAEGVAIALGELPFSVIAAKVVLTAVAIFSICLLYTSDAADE